MFRLSFYFLLLAFACQAQAVMPVEFTPSPQVKENVKVNELLDKQLAAELKSVQAENRKTEQFIENEYKSRTQYYKDAIGEGEFVFNSPVLDYVNTIFRQILEKNSELDNGLHLFISRSGIPNAFSSGDGNIVVNLGLLPYLDNEAQLAFVLCHEMAHQQLKHSEEHLKTYANKFLNKSFRKEMNKALRSKYNVNAKLEKLAIPGALAINRHSRENESEADSLGLIFLSHTGFRLSDALSCMDMLDRANRELDTNLLDFKRYFNPPEFPFNDSWLYYEGSSSLGSFTYEKWYLEDSLKTHPDTKQRKSALEVIFEKKKLQGGAAYVQEEALFHKIQCQSYIDLIYSYLLAGRLDRPLFMALIMKEKFPEQTYADAVINNSMAMLSICQKRRTFGQFVALPSSFNEENYNRLLAFLTELHSSESSSLAYWLSRGKNSVNASTEDYYAALTASAYAAGKVDEFNKLKDSYEKKYPEMKYKFEFEFLEENNSTKNKKK